MPFLYLKDIFLYIMNVSKRSSVYYECLKYVFCMLWLSQRRMWYVMDVLKTSFVCYGCLYVFCKLWMSLSLLYVMDVKKNVFCILWIFERHIFALWMSQRGLLYIMDAYKTSIVRYECFKDVFCMLWTSKRVFRMLWLSQRRLLYVMDVLKTYLVCYGCL